MKNKRLPNWKERRQGEKKLKNNTAVKSTVEKASDKGECLTAPRVLKVSDLVCLLYKKLIHKKCIVHNYKVYLHEDEKDDSENCLVLCYYASSSDTHARR
jgi:hypothetical protein